MIDTREALSKSRSSPTVLVELNDENVTINTGIQSDTGQRFITYTIISNDPLNVLDPLKVLHPVSHFKGQVTANAEIIANQFRVRAKGSSGKTVTWSAAISFIEA